MVVPPRQEEDEQESACPHQSEVDHHWHDRPEERAKVMDNIVALIGKEDEDRI